MTAAGKETSGSGQLSGKIREIEVEERKKRSRFDGNAWFEQQVRTRTRNALTARGVKASAHSQAYRDEYARQLALFRAERAEIKERRRKKYAEREKKRLNAGRTGV